MRVHLGIAEINLKKNYGIFPNRFLTLYFKSNSCILINMYCACECGNIN